MNWSVNLVLFIYLVSATTPLQANTTQSGVIEGSGSVSTATQSWESTSKEDASESLTTDSQVTEKDGVTEKFESTSASDDQHAGTNDVTDKVEFTTLSGFDVTGTDDGLTTTAGLDVAATTHSDSNTDDDSLAVTTDDEGLKTEESSNTDPSIGGTTASTNPGAATQDGVTAQEQNTNAPTEHSSLQPEATTGQSPATIPALETKIYELSITAKLTNATWNEDLKNTSSLLYASLKKNLTSKFNLIIPALTFDVSFYKGSVIANITANVMSIFQKMG